MQIPRIVISGLSGGTGKTMVSLGLARALARSGLRVKAFKKGPDYIDAAWLALASRSLQANLDPFFLPAPALRSLFLQGAAGHDIAIIEGNRGIFDGLDISGSCSTAELSRIVRAPVLLVVDCTKMTRTAAALVSGCVRFEKGLRIGGVILNRTGNPRHQTMARRAVEEFAGVPVIGVLPRRAEPFIAERHMGLVSLDEHARADAGLDALADFIAHHADIDAIRKLAESAPELEPDRVETPMGVVMEVPAGTAGFATAGRRPRIGYVHDAAFWFYYQENLDALRAAGADLVRLSLLDDGAGCVPDAWNHLDGLYIGGGQPELYARALTGNHARRERVAALSRDGLPIYAECGGFIYLAKKLLINGEAFPMAGVFSCSVEFRSRPQGLGYVEAEVLTDNPFHPPGTRFRGHEFHFSCCLESAEREKNRDSRFCSSTGSGPGPSGHVLRLRKGRGMQPSPDGGGFDGLLLRNTFASYTHVFAPALPHWAENFVTLCARRAQNQ